MSFGGKEGRRLVMICLHTRLVMTWRMEILMSGSEAVRSSRKLSMMEMPDSFTTSTPSSGGTKGAIVLTASV